MTSKNDLVNKIIKLMEIICLLVIVAVGVGIFVLNNAAGKSLGKKRRCPRCGNTGVYNN